MNINRILNTPFQTFDGAVDLSEGKISEGTQKVIVGTTATYFGASLLNIPDFSAELFMKYSLYAGSGIAAANGLINLPESIKEGNVYKVAKNISQTAIAATAAVCIEALDTRVIAVAQRASILAFAGYHVSKSGYQDYLKGNYRNGVAKMIVGIGSAAFAGYYVYSKLCNDQTKSELTADQSSFLVNKQQEIESIYTTKEATGDWVKLGKGISKTAFTHPDLPDSIIKIPNYSEFSHESHELYYKHLRSVKQLADDYGFQHIKFPQSVLVETAQGPLIIEERLSLLPEWEVLNGPLKDARISEFKTFTDKSHLCDVALYGTNAGFINGTSDNPKIGVIDFDCVKYYPENVSKSAAVLIGSLVTINKITQKVLGDNAAKKIMTVGAVVGGAASLCAPNPNVGLGILAATVGIGLTQAASLIAYTGRKALSKLF